MLVGVGRGESFVTEAGLSGGGEASSPNFASICFAYCLARPATSERGAADLQAAASAADLSNNRRLDDSWSGEENAMDCCRFCRPRFLKLLL